jgi:hypothetical protein
MAYYYPEGYFGPVCDDGIAELDLARLQRSATDVDDDRVVVFDALLPDDYNTPLGEPVLIKRRCKVRDDGTYYDCEEEWLNYQDAWDDFDRCLDPDGKCYPWKETSQLNFRLEEDFFVPVLTPETCSPFDPDINIRDVSFFTSNGELITYTRKERSSPVTFPVTSNLETIVAESTITASWSGTDLIVGGTGTGLVRLDFEWDDNPNSYGTALSSFSIGGETFVQTSGVREGSDSEWISVTAGQTYTGIVSGGTGYGGYSVQGNKLCFRDLDGNDCNASLTIADTLAASTTTNTGYWSDLGNEYAVWVNPAVCTLPQLEQEVTYRIPIEHTDTYAFQVGCDDTMQIFIGEETTPFMDVVGGIFAGGAYATPYTSTRSLNGGTVLEMTVRCTNSDASFVDGNGNPTGLAFDWGRNPGGWFVRICRGGGCVTGNNIAWVKSGPVSGWGSFMNTYGVYPSNTDVLAGITHSATYNVEVPYTGNYVFEYAADNVGTFSLDGTQIATSTTFNSSSTYTINNLSSGPHTIGVTIVNNASDGVGVPWDNNPAGIGWKLSAPSGNVDVNFDSLGNIVVTGDGNATVVFLFEYDDNPNTYGKAIDNVSWQGTSLDFTQHNDSDGSVQSTISMVAGRTHNIVLVGNTGGFAIQENGKKICFRDEDGNDCNAYVRITSITSQGTVVASSLDLNTSGDGNVIWTTRDATGYEYETT